MMRNKLVYRIALIAILSALSCVLRFSLVEFPNVKPITALFLALALWLGFWDSLAIMTITMIVTGLILGFSPIILGQIFGYAVIIIIFKSISKFNQNIIFLSVIAGGMAFIFGALISAVSGLLYGFGSGGYLAYWIAGLPFDAAHAFSTLIFYPIIVMILKRIKPRH